MADRTGGDLVFAISAQLSRLGRDVSRARLRGRPQHDQSRGPGLCTTHREAAAAVSTTACGSVRIDEIYVKIRGKWRYLYRAIDKQGNPIDFLLTAKRDLDAAKRFLRKMLKDEPLLSPGKIDTDGANTFPSPIKTAVDDGLLNPNPLHYVPKHLQQVIESDYFRVKRTSPRSASVNPSTPRVEQSLDLKQCCGCGKASASPPIGPSTIRTIWSGASSDFKRLSVKMRPLTG